MAAARFEWDEARDRENRVKHSVDFFTAQLAFADSARIIAVDQKHSGPETRYFCFGKVDDEVLTVRFTYRAGVIRIFGAGFWRQGRAIYERENQIHG